MGHGCYYTHDFDSSKKAFWIEIEDQYQDEEGEWMWDDLIFDDEKNNILTLLEDIGYKQYSKGNEWFAENGLFRVEFESTYGNDLLVKLEPSHEEGYTPDEERMFNLAKATHQRSYQRIINHLKKCGYELWMATSGYTSGKL